MVIVVMIFVVVGIWKIEEVFVAMKGDEKRGGLRRKRFTTIKNAFNTIYHYARCYQESILAEPGVVEQV